MLKVLFKGDDLFYLWGMKHYLSQLFAREYGQELDFILGFTHEAVSEADIIIVPLCKGEHHLCIPELYSRNRGVMIGIVDDSVTQYADGMKCSDNIVFIERKETLRRISEKIVGLWGRYSASNNCTIMKNCATCYRKKVSQQQLRIMQGICQGKSTPDIARSLNVSNKTVFAHKYLVMSKFNLRTNHELVTFFNRLVEVNHHSPALTDYFRQSC